jgi:hypothetical protein
VASACPDHGALEVVDEGPLEVLPRVDGAWLETFKPRKVCGSRATGNYRAFVELDPPETSIATE